MLARVQINNRNQRQMIERQEHDLKEGYQIQQFPIKDEERTCTDLFCTYIGIAYTLVILIIAIAVFNGDHYTRTSFPSDSQGRVCGYDLKNHPYVYFTNFPSIKDRVCVNSCPTATDKRLNCVPTDNIGCSFSNNPNFTVVYYPNSAELLQIGSFCAPTDESLKQKLYQQIDVTDRYSFFKQIKSIVLCGCIALGLALLYVFAVQWFPKIMNYLSIILGLTFAFIMLCFVIFYPTDSIAFRITFSIIFLILVVIVGIGAFKSKACFNMHGVFLFHATNLLKQKFSLLLFIPIFLGVFVLFVFIIILELKSLWSSVELFYTDDKIYYQFYDGSTTLWTTVVLFQFLWGLSFIKESFNFCISGNALQWYDKEQMEGQRSQWSLFNPIYYLFRYHFGSIVAGSFMSLVFSFFDYLFDVLRADFNDSNTRKCLNVFDSFFDLVRSDAMTYIYIAGNPYCNSSRYCQYLCNRSPIAEYSQSISRSYRICSHFFLAGIVATISFFLQGSEVSIFIVLLVFIISLFITTFFISLHADAAEAIQIIFLLDYEFAKQQEKNTKLHSIPKLNKLRNKIVANDYHHESEEIKDRIKQEKQASKLKEKQLLRDELK